MSYNITLVFLAAFLSISGCGSQIQRRKVVYMDVVSFDSASKPSDIGFMVFTRNNSAALKSLSPEIIPKSIYSYYPIEKSLLDSWKITNSCSLKNILLFENDSFDYLQLAKASNSNLERAIKGGVILNDLTHYDIIYKFDTSVQLKNKCIVGLREVSMEYFMLVLDSGTTSEANSCFFNSTRIQRKVGIFQSKSTYFSYIPVRVLLQSKETVIPLRVLSTLSDR